MSELDVEPEPGLIESGDDSAVDDQNGLDAAPPLLATVAQFNATSGLSVPDDDPRATAKLRAASGRVRDYLRQYVTKVDDDVIEVEALGIDNGKIIYMLPELPVRPGAVTLVEYMASDDTWTAAAETAWRLKNDGILEARLGVNLNWRAGHEPIRVTYTHGWTNIPDSILDAVLGVAERSYLSPAQLESKRLGERSEKYMVFDGGFSPLELVGLDRYRQLV